MEIKYTDSGKKELEVFLDGQRNLLEEQIKKEKYVFGDECIEISERDIKDASNQILFIPKLRVYRYSSTKLLLKIYFLLGVISVFFGVFNKQINLFFQERREGFWFVILGLMLIILSALATYYLKSREERIMRKR